LVVYYLLGQVTGHSPVKACDSCSVESYTGRSPSQITMRTATSHPGGDPGM